MRACLRRKDRRSCRRVEGRIGVERCLGDGWPIRWRKERRKSRGDADRIVLLADVSRVPISICAAGETGNKAG